MRFKFNNNTDIFLEEFEKGKYKAAHRVGERAVDFVADLAPYNTGFLRNSITYALSGEGTNKKTYSSDNSDSSEKRNGEYDGKAPNDKNLSIYIGTNVEYAQARELGTRNSAASPYLRPGITNNKKTFENIYNDELQTAKQRAQARTEALGKGS